VIPISEWVLSSRMSSTAKAFMSRSGKQKISASPSTSSAAMDSAWSR